MNIVVYEAKRTADKKSLDPKNPMDVYWLDIDPANVAANRKKGKMDDRSELIWVEKQMAYGLSSEPMATAGHYKIILVALSSRPVTLSLDSNSAVHAQCIIDGKKSELHRIYVFAVERTIGWPRVEYIELFGASVDKGEPTYEKYVQ
jgi:hypothetical protein